MYKIYSCGYIDFLTIPMRIYQSNTRLVSRKTCVPNGIRCKCVFLCVCASRGWERRCVFLRVHWGSFRMGLLCGVDIIFTAHTHNHQTHDMDFGCDIIMQRVAWRLPIATPVMEGDFLINIVCDDVVVWMLRFDGLKGGIIRVRMPVWVEAFPILGL